MLPPVLERNDTRCKELPERNEMFIISMSEQLSARNASYVRHCLRVRVLRAQKGVIDWSRRCLFGGGGGAGLRLVEIRLILKVKNQCV